jgi:peptidoglycan/LPS O-acetylase OafA/YrhL
MQEQLIIKNGIRFLSGDSSFLIDILRVLACEMVVFCHVFNIFDQYHNLPLNNSNIFYEIDIFLGDTGVVLFFIVSGIVISNSLLNKLESDYSYGFVHYFIDRFSRIYTGLIPALVLIFIGDLALLAINPNYFYTMETRSTSISILTFLGNIFMLQNLKFLSITTPAYGGIIWTLNIEWWLYLVFGWIAVNIKKNAKMGFFFFIPLLLFLYYPAYLFLKNAYENLVIVWFMGVAATMIYLYIGKISWSKRIDYSIIGVLTLILGRSAVIYKLNKIPFDLTFELLLVILIILLMIKYKNSNRFNNTKLRSTIKFMGKYTFTLYLTHFIIENLIFSIYLTLGLNYSLIVVFAFAIILANIVAIIIAYPTEMQYKSVARMLKNKIIKHT